MTRAGILLSLFTAMAPAVALAGETVTLDTFPRAESDNYFSNVVREAGLGTLGHRRKPASVDQQIIIRMNRDTLYSGGVFDLEAGPVTVTLPEADGRFMSMMAVNQDHYVQSVRYEGTETFDKDNIGTRYVALIFRTFVDPEDAADIEAVHALQDAITVEQAGGPGVFEVPEWDAESRKEIRDLLLGLARHVDVLDNAYGPKDQVDPVHHLIGTARGWGGNPDSDAMYIHRFPEQADGGSVYKLTLGADVPVEGFWSVTVYDENGYLVKNDLDAYALNGITAARNSDGSVDIQFGGCDGEVPNCLPTFENWNYSVRLYRPGAALLDGSWQLPEAVKVE